MNHRAQSQHSTLHYRNYVTARAPSTALRAVPLPRYRGGGWRALLRRGRDVVIADHVAPQLYLALEQRRRGFGGFLVGRVKIHAALRKGLLQLGIGERGAQRGVELVDDRARRAGGRQQHVPEVDVELGVAELA